jgi:hypothetical protein
VGDDGIDEWFEGGPTRTTNSTADQTTTARLLSEIHEILVSKDFNKELMKEENTVVAYK